jgi:hypothetical protein
MTFEKKDYGIVAGSILVLLAASTVSMIVGLPIMVEGLIDGLSGLVILSSLYYVYKGVGLAGGAVGRSMALVAAGVGYYGLHLLPHLYYHISHPEYIGPLQGEVVEVFMHVSTTLAFFVVAWGFYILYRGGTE